MPNHSRSLRQSFGRRATSSGLSTIHEDRVWSMNDSNSSFSEPANDPESPVITEEAVTESLETYRVGKDNQSSWRRRYNKWASNLLPTRNDLSPLKELRFWKHRYHDASSADSLHRLRQSRSVNNLEDYYRGDRNEHANLSVTSLPEGSTKKNWFRRGTVSLATRLGVGSSRDWEDVFGGDRYF
jgi:hypothetical protein